MYTEFNVLEAKAEFIIKSNQERPAKKEQRKEQLKKISPKVNPKSLQAKGILILL
jgi:hypothetical protein